MSAEGGGFGGDPEGGADVEGETLRGRSLRRLQNHLCGLEEPPQGERRHEEVENEEILIFR